MKQGHLSCTLSWVLVVIWSWNYASCWHTSVSRSRNGSFSTESTLMTIHSFLCRLRWSDRNEKVPPDKVLDVEIAQIHISHFETQCIIESLGAAWNWAMWRSILTHVICCLMPMFIMWSLWISMLFGWYRQSMVPRALALYIAAPLALVAVILLAIQAHFSLQWAECMHKSTYHIKRPTGHCTTKTDDQLVVERMSIITMGAQKY